MAPVAGHVPNAQQDRYVAPPRLLEGFRALTGTFGQPPGCGAELRQLLDRIGRIAMTHPELMDLGRMFHISANVADERAIARVRSTVIAWVTDVPRAGQTLGVVRSDLPLDLLTAWTIASLTAIDQWTLTATTPITARRAAAETALENLWQLLIVEERSGPLS